MKITRQLVHAMLKTTALCADEAREKEIVETLTIANDWIDKIKDIDVSNHEPVYSLADKEGFGLVRPESDNENDNTKLDQREEIMSSANDTDDDFFMVPKVL